MVPGKLISSYSHSSTTLCTFLFFFSRIFPQLGCFYLVASKAIRKIYFNTLEKFCSPGKLEKFLNEWEELELANRREVVDKILEFQNKMGEKYGVMPDSTELIREDRRR